jgi:hypothetical protein
MYLMALQLLTEGAMTTYRAQSHPAADGGETAADPDVPGVVCARPEPAPALRFRVRASPNGVH